ncbi:MAG: efflux transporter outer membrane subunit [Sulfitobacter sp.]
MGFYESRGLKSPMALTLLAAVFVSGCDLSLPYNAPNMRLSDKYSLIAPVHGPSLADERWWTDFHDPVLNQLIDQAFADNPSLRQAAARIREAEAGVRAAGNTVSGDGRLQGTVANTDSDNAEVGLSALFDPFGVGTARKKASAARLEAARLGELDARRLLLSEVAQSYVNMRFFQKSLVERNQDLRSRRVTLREITTQRDIGVSTELDVVRAKALVAELQVDLPKLGASIVRERNRLSTLVGKPVGMMNINLAFSGRQPNPPGLSKVGVPADILRNRPDVRAAERLYAAAVSGIDEAHAARYPRLSLSGVIRAPFGGGSSSESLSAGLVLPVFNQPTLQAEVGASAARADQAYEEWRQVVLTAVEEVETALNSLHASYAAVRASRQVVTLNENALNLSRRLLESRGNITVLDLLDRERTVTTSRSVLTSNQRDLAVDFISLRVALGMNTAPMPDHVVASVE